MSWFTIVHDFPPNADLVPSCDVSNKDAEDGNILVSFSNDFSAGSYCGGGGFMYAFPTMSDFQDVLLSMKVTLTNVTMLKNSALGVCNGGLFLGESLGPPTGGSSCGGESRFALPWNVHVVCTGGFL